MVSVLMDNATTSSVVTSTCISTTLTINISTQDTHYFSLYSIIDEIDEFMLLRKIMMIKEKEEMKMVRKVQRRMEKPQTIYNSYVIPKTIHRTRSSC
jgi:hypothetical protein